MNWRFVRRALAPLARLLLFGCAAYWALMAAALAAPTQALLLDQAWRTPVAPTAGAEAERIRLPDAWNRVERSGTWHYRIDFDLPQRPAEDWGLYIPRIGNRARIEVNGSVVGQLGALAGDVGDYSQRPHYFLVPAALLRAGANAISITLQGERARYGGLSTLSIGPAAQVHPRFLLRETLQTWGSFGMAAISAALALLAGMLALAARDRLLGLFTLACVFSVLRLGFFLVVTPPFDHRAWRLLSDFGYAGYVVTLGIFCFEVLGLKRRWPLWGAGAVALVSAIALPWHAYGLEDEARQIWTMVMLAYGTALSVYLVLVWWRTRAPASLPLALAGALSVMLGLYDHLLVFYSADGYGTFALTRYSLLIFLTAMAWVLAERHLTQLRREQQLRAQLAEELEQRKRELAAQFDAQRQLIEANAQQRERERLVHDLHDGLGLQLNTLLNMTEHAPTSREAGLADEVRTAIEQLRLLVDNARSFDGDLGQLFGHIRFRLESRLERCGIGLDWRVRGQLPASPVDAPRAVALQHLMFELATNVMKHAAARRMSVVVHVDEAAAGVRLEVADDGRGFDPAVTYPGAGMRSIRRRVDDLQGSLEIRAAPGGGTLVQVLFPLPQGAAAEAGRGGAGSGGAGDAPPALAS